MEVIKVKPTKEGKIIIKLFGTVYEIIIEKDEKEIKAK